MAEEAFLRQKGMFLDARRSLQAKTKEESAAAAPVASSPRTALPRIQLQTFSGKYEDWPLFRDLFHSIIGKDAGTTPVEKLQYLKSCLKGEAELLLRSLPTTDEKYERAWTTLTGYYENKRLLVRSYISRFTALHKLKGESATDLRKLQHGVMSTIGALESIDRPITRGEDLFVHLIVDLLDPRSRREWENSVGENAEPPPLSELQQFIDRRLHTLESLQGVRGDSGTKSDSERRTRALHARPREEKRGRCTVCQKDILSRCATAIERNPPLRGNNTWRLTGCVSIAWANIN